MNMRKKIKELIIKHYIFSTIILLFFLTIMIPLCINVLFKKSSLNILSAEWGPGDLLQFYGSILSFVGSVIVSSIALYQTQKLKEKENEFVFSNTRRPYFRMTTVILHKKKDKEDVKYLKFVRNAFIYESTESKENVEFVLRIKNVGEGEAIGLTYVDGAVGRRNMKGDEPYHDVATEGDIAIYKDLVLVANKKTGIEITYYNVLGCRYSQMIYIEVSELYESDNDVKYITKIYPMTIQKVK